MKRDLLVTCEHGGRRVPARYRALFAEARGLLESHRGWDPGALVLARGLARARGAPLLACTPSRLVVDANRPLGHPRLFSDRTRSLPEAERERLLDRYWRPHWTAVEAFVREAARRRRTALHVSVHSFTPVLDGRVREVDVGFLYDPARRPERDFVTAWIDALGERDPTLRLRRNQPYRGTSDGLTTSHRERFDATHYLGIELEISQAFPHGDPARWRRLRQALTRTLTAS